MTLSFLEICASVSLFMAILSLWVPLQSKILVGFCLVLTIILGVMSGTIAMMGLIVLASFSALIFGFKTINNTWLKCLIGLGVFVLGFAITQHLAPGFNNIKVFDGIQLSAEAYPYVMYFNTDKTIVGVLILMLLHPIIKKFNQWPAVFKDTLPIAMLTVSAMIILGLMSGFVSYSPKWPSELLLWAPTNLLLVCVCEEALYRGFVQKQLTHAFGNFRWGVAISLVIASILFGLSHFRGGPMYMMFCAMAGLTFGWAYHKTQRIEASILAHFSLNFVHFCLFSYPALKPIN